MALSANTTWEVRTAGNDTNGGGFVTGASGNDYSQQDSKNTVGSDISTTDAVANGTTTITSASANFGTTIIGNIIYLQGGTGSLAASRYQVTARASTTSITVDRTVAAGTGITMNIGGAVGSLGILGSTTATILVDENRIFIKSGTYTISSSSNNVSNGLFNKNTILYIEGYQTTRGDMGTPPLLQADGVITTFAIISHSPTTGYIKNINVDGNNRSTSKGFNLSGSGGFAYKCKAVNCTNSGFAGSGGQVYVTNCVATGCSNQPAFTGLTCIGCVAYDNTVTGFNNGNAITEYVRCIADSNTGASSNGFTDAGLTACYINCVAYGNGQHGFSFNGNNRVFINCIAESNTGSGFFNAGSRTGIAMFNCAYYNNGTNVNIGSAASNINTGGILGSGSFFTNAASADFSLNNTGGAGAAARAAGIFGAFGNGTTTGYLDIGAAQHQDSASGGGERSAVF